MIVFSIFLIITGIAFLIFGYLIRFRKKYDLINGFKDDLGEGRRDERYAERVGLIELIAGAVFIVSGAVLTLFAL